MPRLISTPILLIISASIVLHANASEHNWWGGEGIVNLSHITPENARSEAHNIARQDALSKARLEVVGYTASSLTELSTRDDDQVYDHFTRFVRTITRGRILKEDILFDGIEQQPIPGTNRTQPIYRVKIRVQIHQEEGEPDPAFKLSINLNEESFREGETITLELKATRDCYVTVFNLYAHDSLRIWFPHEFDPYNFLQKGKSFFIPDPDALWDIPLGLLPGKEIDVESVLVIATKDNIPFTTLRAVTVEGALAMDQALTTISNWLIEIPIDRRTEDMATYRVVKH